MTLSLCQVKKSVSHSNRLEILFSAGMSSFKSPHKGRDQTDGILTINTSSFVTKSPSPWVSYKTENISMVSFSEGSLITVPQVLIAGNYIGKPMQASGAQYLTLPSDAQLPACNMLSATVQMQYYPGAQQVAYSGYGKQRNSYYGALADPIPSPSFLPTPPLQSPLSLYTTAR